MILPLLHLSARLLRGAAAAAAVIAVVAVVKTIAFDDVMQHLRGHKIASDDVAELIMTMLESGEVKVVGSTLSRTSMGGPAQTLRGRETFTGKLDPKLESLFGGKERVVIEL